MAPQTQIAEAWMHTELEAGAKRHEGKPREARQILSDFLAAHPDHGPALTSMGCARRCSSIRPIRAPTAG
jgi:hypothetical protein